MVRIVDEYTDRTDLSEKQKYARRYPDKIKEQQRKQTLKNQTSEGKLKHNKRLRDWRKKNPDKVANYNRDQRLKRYKITENDYQNFLVKQNNSCAICKNTEPGGLDWAIDHCHKTNIVRGLLCISCNTAIGSLKENPELFKAALNYLNISLYERNNCT